MPSLRLSPKTQVSICYIGYGCHIYAGVKETFFKPKAFRTDFSEIFKGSPNFDVSKSNRVVVNFSDGDKRVCRTTWQNKKTRFRVIPETVPAPGQAKQSIKKELPVIYLGLSRLYPIGEADKCSYNSIMKLSNEACSWIKENTKKYFTC